MVSSIIAWEGLTLLSALFWGMVLSVEYDCIRIFRRVVRHTKVWTMSVEDIIFWVNAAITVFVVTYDVNNGIVRGFLLAGFVLGGVIYRYSFGLFCVKYGSRLILIVLKPLKKMCSAIRMLLKKIFLRIKITVHDVHAARAEGMNNKKAKKNHRKNKGKDRDNEI